MWLTDGIANSSDWTFLKTGPYYEEIKIGIKKIINLFGKNIYLNWVCGWL